jgi:MFS family permease
MQQAGNPAQPVPLDASELTEAEKKQTMRKVTWRLVPLLIIGYFISYIDRVNISFAKFGFEDDFNMDAATYGLAAGIFFLGYILAEVPSNIFMVRFGARKWLARIMISWGIVGALMAVAWNSESVIVLRFLLGIAEAGFFPGIILYLTYWYPNRERAKVVATVMMAIPIAGLVGGPLNGWILDTFGGLLGLDAWRWIFLVGGVPALILGIVFLFTLSDSPAKAKWLTDRQRTWIASTIAAEDATRSQTAPKGHWAALKNKKVLVLAAVYFLLQCGAYPLIYWLPSVIKGVGPGFDATTIGWLSAIPFLAAAICMYIVGKTVSTRRPSPPLIIALAISTLAFAATALLLGPAPALAFLAVIVATMAIQTSKPLFWNLPTSFLAGVGAASGIALINSLGNAAGFFSTLAFGWIQDATGSSAVSITVMVATNGLAALVVIALMVLGRRKAAGTPAEK